MSKRRAPLVTIETPIGPDVDLEREDVRLPNRRRLTSAVAEEIVTEVRRVGGRPSLSGESTPSPQITFRVPAEIRDRAAQVAAAEGKTVSQLAREALEARLASRHRPHPPRTAGPGLSVVDLAEVESAAVIIHRRSMDDVLVTDQVLARWVDANGYRSVGHAREVTLEWSPDPNEWVTELQQPIYATGGSSHVSSCT